MQLHRQFFFEGFLTVKCTQAACEKQFVWTMLVLI